MLDTSLWVPDVTMNGGYNGEFQVYVDDPVSAYVEGGNLFIKPGFTADWLDGGEEEMKTGILDLTD